MADWLVEAEQLGQRMSMNARAFVTATLAELRGDLELAEAETAWSVEQLDEGGQRGLVATLAGFQSILLGRLGRWDEAAAAASIAREQSHPDDLDSEAFWRRAEAQVIAHRGDLEGVGDAAIKSAALSSRSWIRWLSRARSCFSSRQLSQLKLAARTSMIARNSVRGNAATGTTD